MKTTRHTTEQIITKLREVERLQAEGQSIAQACRQVSISEHTFYHWRKRYDTMPVDEATQRLGTREPATEAFSRRPSPRHLDVERGSQGKVLSPPRRRAEHRLDVWSYDFVMDATEDGRRLKMLPRG